MIAFRSDQAGIAMGVRTEPLTEAALAMLGTRHDRQA
jgi:hypothetical protein